MRATAFAPLLIAGLMLSHAADAADTLSEQGIIREVLAANPTLKSALAKWTAMKERVPQARAWEDPMVGVDFERMGTTRFSTYADAEWMASQTVPLAGKNISRGRAAEAEARAAYEEVRRVRLDVTAKARGAYFRLANARAQLAVIEKNRGLLSQFVEVIKGKIAVAAAAQAEALAAETDLQKLDQERVRMEQELSDQQSMLNVLMNRPAKAPIGEPAPLAFKEQRWSAGTLESLILAQRPEVNAAERTVAAEQARLQLARREWIPEPQFRVEARHFRGSSDAFTEYDTGIFFSVPWLNFRKYSAGVREAAASVESARQAHGAARVEALGMLRDTLRKIASLSQQYHLSTDKIVPLARQTVETLRAGYQAGTSGYLEVLTAQRTLREAEAAASAQLADYLATLAELEAVVGIEPDAAPAPKAIKQVRKK